MERETGMHLAFPCGDDGVTRNQLGEDTASSLDAEGKRANIDENIFTTSIGTREGPTLNSGTISDGLIRVDSIGKLLTTKELFEEPLNFGDTSWSSGKNDLWMIS